MMKIKFTIQTLIFLFLFTVLIIIFTIYQINIRSSGSIDDVLNRKVVINKTDKKFVDKEFGWEIMYARDIEVSVHDCNKRIGGECLGNSVDFTRSGPTQGYGTEFHDGLSVTIYVEPKDANQTLENFLAVNSVDGYTKEIISYSELELNGFMGYEFDYWNIKTFMFPFPKLNDKVLVINVSSKGKDRELYDREYKKMLTSLKFLEN